MANRRILVIDDNVEIWKAYQDVLAPGQDDSFVGTREIAHLLESEHDNAPLTSPEFRLRFAHQGQEGFGLVQEALYDRMPFAVAFIDIRMPPGWDGMKTAKKIREIDPNIEIVIVTAYSDRSREEVARVVGRSDKLLFLRKPFDADELFQIALSLSEKWTIERQEESQRRDLETILNTSPVAIFTVNSSCRITSWNPAASVITGYSAADVLGKTCIFRKISRNECSRCPIINDEQSDSSKNCTEHTIVDKTGDEKIISKKISFERDAKGHILKSVESFWDITDKKESEMALQSSEARFRSLVETTNDWVWEMDNDARFTYCSPVCENIYGFLPEELLGRTVFETILPPDEAAHFELIFNQCVQKKKGFRNVERRSMAKDGSIIYVESSCKSVFDDTGQLLGFRGIDRDITDRKKIDNEKTLLEEQFRQSQKMEVLGTLAGGIAHDFNNVLTPIMLNTQVSMMGLDHDSPLYQHLLDINKSAEKASALIRQIMAFSRKQMLMPRPLDLNEIINDFTKMLRRLIREDVELQLNLADDLWTITGDASQIEQVLINLVVNARDAIRDNGTITIETHNEEITDQNCCDIENKPISGSFVVLTVRDTGAGIDKASVEQIFDPFFTTKEAGHGTGLGLSLVRGIICQYDGHLRFETEAGKGTTFYAYFHKSDKPVEIGKPREDQYVQGGEETILLAEDNMEVRFVIMTTLANYGYNVIEARNGRDAVRIFEKINGKVDMLLTDVVMPGLGGIAVAERLCTIKPDLPVIFMSGHPFDPATLKFSGDEYCSFIQKPFYPKNIARKIREMLDKVGSINKTEGTEV